MALRWNDVQLSRPRVAAVVSSGDRPAVADARTDLFTRPASPPGRRLSSGPRAPALDGVGRGSEQPRCPVGGWRQMDSKRDAPDGREDLLDCRIVL
jgi:hypothetical protein